MFEELIPVSNCLPGQSIFVRHKDKELAVYHLLDPPRFVVSQNTCPHARGNLSAGTVTNHTVTCPVHHWKFDLETGYCVGTDDVVLKRYACKVQNDMLLADLDHPLPIPPPPRYDF